MGGARWPSDQLQRGTEGGGNNFEPRTLPLISKSPELLSSLSPNSATGERVGSTFNNINKNKNEPLVSVINRGFLILISSTNIFSWS